MCHGVTPHARAGLFSAANLLQGRVDVWCRCVTAGLYLSDDVRRDTVVHLVMQSDDLASCRLVSVDGARVEGLAPAEKNVALLLQRAMQHASLDQLPTLARDAPGGRRSRGGDGTASEAGDGDEVREKSARNARKRVGAWLAKRPGSAGPVPGIAVSDHQSLETCLRDALRGCGAVALLDVDGDDASCVLACLAPAASPRPPRRTGTATVRIRRALPSVTRASDARKRIAAAAASTSLPTGASETFCVTL